MVLHTAVARSVAEICSKSQIMLNFSAVTEYGLLHRKLDSHDTTIADELFRGNDVHNPHFIHPVAQWSPQKHLLCVDSPRCALRPD